MRHSVLATLMLMALLAGPPGLRAQPVAPAQQDPGTYVLNLASGALQPVGTSVLNAAWSPDSALLALAESPVPDPVSGRLRIVEVATGRETAVELPAPVDWLRPMSWAPDGSRLAFRLAPSRATSGSLLYVLQIGERTARQLLPDVLTFAWTPDSQAITAIEVMPPGAAGRIVTLDATTGQPAAVVHLADNVRCQAGAGLAWSPDGAYLAFGGPGPFGGVEPALSCIGPAGKGLWSWEASTGRTWHLVTDQVTSRPLWTVGGEILVETTEAARSFVRVHPDGSGSSTLASNIPAPHAPPFTPFSLLPEAADEVVLYDILRCDQGGVFVIAPGSAEPHRLSDTAVFAFSPHLSPDGASVAWMIKAADGHDLVLAAVDGSDVRTVLQGTPGLGLAGWSPDGEWLLLARAAAPVLRCGCTELLCPTGVRGS